jgi:hypothetical protein
MRPSTTIAILCAVIVNAAPVQNASPPRMLRKNAAQISTELLVGMFFFFAYLKSSLSLSY